MRPGSFVAIAAIQTLVFLLAAADETVLPAETGGSRASLEARGAFEKVLEYFSRFLTGSEEAPDARGDRTVFSKNAYTYIAAFWKEIVNAPRERTFVERIKAFLDAVRVKKHPPTTY
jgi:hypothetical protein